MFNKINLPILNRLQMKGVFYSIAHPCKGVNAFYYFPRFVRQIWTRTYCHRRNRWLCHREKVNLLIHTFQGVSRHLQVRIWQRDSINILLIRHVYASGSLSWPKSRISHRRCSLPHCHLKIVGKLIDSSSILIIYNFSFY